MPELQIRVLDTYNNVERIYRRTEGTDYKIAWYGPVEMLKEDMGREEERKDRVLEWRVRVVGVNVGVLSPNKVYRGMQEVERELGMKQALKIHTIMIVDRCVSINAESRREQDLGKPLLQQGRVRVAYGLESRWLTLRADRSEEYYGNYIIYKQMRYYMQPDMMRVDVLKTQRYYSKHKQEVDKLNMKEKVVI